MIFEFEENISQNARMKVVGVGGGGGNAVNRWTEAPLEGVGFILVTHDAQALLSVNPHTLETNGAVSRETVIEMASGALVHSGASVSVAVTGFAGPAGAPTDRPRGTIRNARKWRGCPPRGAVW